MNVVHATVYVVVHGTTWYFSAWYCVGVHGTVCAWWYMVVHGSAWQYKVGYMKNKPYIIRIATSYP